MFIDNVKIYVKGGTGGKGCQSFYRDKYQRKGIPDGGDGGRGADIIIRADRNLHTLLDFQFNRHFYGAHGAHGSGKNKKGKDASSILIRVPMGTVVKDLKTDCLLRDLSSDQEEFIVARGGKGGVGNRYHREATPGEAGEEKELFLDLKLIADVGIVGFPNAGKSTLISNISNAHPKVAAYPFTTKSPILGVVNASGRPFVIADIPGLIEGSSSGKGLGDKFLRHIERTKILVHLIDMAGYEGRDPLKDYAAINNELKKYGKDVFKKPQLVVANKMDLESAPANLKRFKASIKKIVFPVSALKKEGLEGLIEAIAKNYKRVVIKVGSSFLCADGLHLSCLALRGIAETVTGLVKDGHEVVIVSSGAIAFGMHILGFKERPKELHYLQAASAVGQNELMDHYRELFREKKINSSQVLLTWDDFTDKKRYSNTRNTLLTLLKLGCVPVINENDTVSTDEIKFGDNDRLSALVASLISADLLIILSDVQGLLDKEKNLVRVVPEITVQIKDLASPTSRKTSVGGMVTKIEAAKIAVDSGIPCVIADGKNPALISRIINETDLIGDWTLFLPKKSYLASNKRWIAFSAKPKGRIIVDEGAKKALINKKSLLSVGVVGVSGNFECRDVIAIVDREGREFARGKACISSVDLDKVKGARFEKEIVHCDNIVISG